MDLCIYDHGRVAGAEASKQLKTKPNRKMDRWMDEREGRRNKSPFVNQVDSFTHSPSGKRKATLRVKTNAVLVYSLFCIKALRVCES